MTSRVLSGALIAGLLAGCLSALLQLALLRPFILEAETYEVAAATAPHAHDDAAAPHDHDHAAPAGEGGIGRTFGTVAMTLVAFAGFGLVMGTGLALAARAGHRIDARTGVLWGLAGFAAVHLAPAMGLPPELPGSVAADLGARQAWWALCVGSTALGLAALAYGRSAVPLVAGAALVALPHLVGAPVAPSHEGLVPPGLAAAFVGRALGVGCLAWAALGLMAGALAARPGPAAATATRPA